MNGQTDSQIQLSVRVLNRDFNALGTLNIITHQVMSP